MVKIFEEISQSAFAKFQNQYFSDIGSSKTQNDIEFQLHVGSDNFMELQYYILLLDSLKKQINKSDFICKTTITSNATGSLNEKKKQWGRDWGRINTYLSCFSDSFFKERNIFAAETFGNLRLTSPNELDFGRIIPLIPVDKNIFKFLSQRIEEAFAPSTIIIEGEKRFCCAPNIKTEKVKTIGKDGKEHTRTKKTFEIFIQGLNFQSKAAQNVLYSACMKYLFGFDNRSATKDYFDLFNERIVHYSSPEFFNKIKNISVLSLLIFCAYNRFNLLDKLDYIQTSDKYKQNSPKFSKEILIENNVYPNYAEDESTLINALDMADGLLQLIENEVFHAGTSGKQNGFGVLSLRVYKAGQESRQKYLNNKYKHYFEGHDNRHRIVSLADEKGVEISSYQQHLLYAQKDITQLSRVDLDSYSKNREAIDIRKKDRADSAYYLEVRLADNSGKNMCTVFLNNHKNDQPLFPFGSPQENRVKVSTFFNPDNAEQQRWKKFTENPNNVIHHYGLQLFDAMLQSVDGCFLVQSIADGEQANNDNFFSSSGDQLFDDKVKYFSGTQYSILLPFVTTSKKPYSFINTNIDFPLPSGSFYTKGKENSEEISKFAKVLAGYKSLPYRNQEEKKSCIERLIKSLDAYHLAENLITIFDADDLSAQNVELFAKSIMQFIAKNSEKEINIAITNCDDDTFKQLIRTFAIFYDRTGSNNLMRNTQIYLSGKSKEDKIAYKDEFLLAGANLHDTLTAQIKLDAARGLTQESHSGILSFLTDMLKRRPGKGTGGAKIKYIPFDLLVKKQDISIFEQNVINTLMSDVQQKNPGCRLTPNHMRIGSKVHVDQFYEATVMFENNYYTGRFAWLLKERIVKIHSDPCTEESPYLFIGYESYSEILLRDICRQLPNAKYCVFEYGKQDPSGKTSKDRFRRLNMLVEEQVYQPIYIVPISSTLSTFDKLEASFKIEIEKNKNKGVTINITPDAKYFGVIQTRHGNSDEVVGCEAEFFASIDTADKSITSKLLSNRKVYYIFCVQAVWSNPLQCEQCYPERDNFISEKPLIETDKTSVIPTQLYGIKRIEKRMIPISKKSEGKISELYNHVLFGHTCRNSNHFQYYIETDKLFEEANKKKGKTSKIHRWLEAVRNEINYKNIIHYDIIICPEHYSNSGFVKLVNEVVFGGASLVIGVNTEKEFRDNFITKHSDIANIVENLSSQHGKGEINFHYVDDTIIHGTNFHRVKSLVNSLCKKIAISVDVNVFKSVIVLLNRNSSYSIKNYHNSHTSFHAYLNLFISSLRTHYNACILCQDAVENDKLSKRASLNITSTHFSDKIDNPQEVMNCANKKSSEYTRVNYNNFILMVCTHYLNKAISETQEKNYRSSTLQTLLTALVDSLKKADKGRNDKLDGKMPVPDSMTLIISYIIAASSPFQSFRKSTREAVFKLILLLFEVLLNPNLKDGANRKTFIEKFFDCSLADEDESDETELIKQNRDTLESDLLELTDIIIKLAEKKSNKHMLLQVLMNQSVNLKSNYIIRRDNVIRILWVSITDQFDHVKINQHTDSFIGYYLFQIKKLIASSSDEAKAMFVEYILLSGKEYPKLIDSNEYLKHSHQNFGILDKELTGSIIRQYFGATIKSEDEAEFNNSLRILVHSIFLENTQVIYDAIGDLVRHKDSDVNRLYFLENYKTLLDWNDCKIQTTRGELVEGEDTLKRAGHIVSLYTHLTQNGKHLNWGQGNEYYTTVLDCVRQILSVEKVYLFIYIGESIQLLFPDDCHAESDIVEYVQSVATSSANHHIGHTYFIGNGNSAGIRAIKFSHTQSRKQSENKSFVWYLAFKIKATSTDPKLAELVKARNLLAMRSTILERLERDFENNHSFDYVMLKEKLIKLSNEKTGSHTPFKELSDSFNLIFSKLNGGKGNSTSNDIIAALLKLISDSIISKMYVYNITQKLPEQIDPEPALRDCYSIGDYKKILEQVQHLTVDRDKSEILPDIVGFDCINWSEKLMVPDKSGFIWCSSFIALILNALRHGKDTDSKVKIRVNIEKNKSNTRCITIRNMKNSNSNKQGGNNGSMTLSALKYFFHSYGFSGFDWNETDPQDFIVWLPLEEEKNHILGDNNND